MLLVVRKELKFQRVRSFLLVDLFFNIVQKSLALPGDFCLGGVYECDEIFRCLGSVLWRI